MAYGFTDDKQCSLMVARVYDDTNLFATMSDGRFTFVRLESLAVVDSSQARANVYEPSKHTMPAILNL